MRTRITHLLMLLGLLALMLFADLPDTSPDMYLLRTCDFPGSTQFYGLMEDDPMVTYMLSICSSVQDS